MAHDDHLGLRQHGGQGVPCTALCIDLVYLHHEEEHKASTEVWPWVKIQPPGIGPQVLVQSSTYQGNPFWGYPISDPQPHGCVHVCPMGKPHDWLWFPCGLPAIAFQNVCPQRRSDPLPVWINLTHPGFFGPKCGSQ